MGGRANSLKLSLGSTGDREDLHVASGRRHIADSATQVSALAAARLSLPEVVKVSDPDGASTTSQSTLAAFCTVA